MVRSGNNNNTDDEFNVEGAGADLASQYPYDEPIETSRLVHDQAWQHVQLGYRLRASRHKRRRSENHRIQKDEDSDDD